MKTQTEIDDLATDISVMRGSRERRDAIIKLIADETVNNAKANVSSSVFDWMKSEVTASMIMGLPDDEYKKGHNDAMRKALRIIKDYKEGKGLFQQ